MFKLLERYMIQQLGKTDLTQKQIRQTRGISERTQRRIRAEHAVTKADDANFRKLRSVGRPSTADAYEQLVRDWLDGPRQPADGPLKGLLTTKIDEGSFYRFTVAISFHSHHLPHGPYSPCLLWFL